MRVALYAAAMRGVDVRVMIPQKPDHRLVWLASIAHANRMISHDVKVFRYTKGFLHQKVILVDEQDRRRGHGQLRQPLVPHQFRDHAVVHLRAR